MKKFDFETTRTIATLSEKDNYSKRLTLTAWNGNLPTLDLRTWRQENDGRLRPLKGLTLSENETEALRTALADLHSEQEGKK